MSAIEEAGGLTFMAVMHTTFYDRVGDVLTPPVLQAGIIHHLARARDTFTTDQGL